MGATVLTISVRWISRQGLVQFTRVYYGCKSNDGDSVWPLGGCVSLFTSTFLFSCAWAAAKTSFQLPRTAQAAQAVKQVQVLQVRLENMHTLKYRSRVQVTLSASLN